VALQGTLETFALPDVLRLLASTKKTGCYKLDGDRGAGVLWLKEGQVVGGSVNGAPAGDVTEVAFELLRFSDGDFVFEQDVEPPADTGSPLDVEAVLDGAEKSLEEWKGIEAVVPSLDHFISLRAELPEDEVTIRADKWLLVTVIGSGLTVGRLGAMLGLGELPVSRSVKELFELGLIELSESAPAGAAAPAPAPAAAPAPAPEPEPVFEPEPALTLVDNDPITDDDSVIEFAPFGDADDSADADPFAPFDPNGLIIEEPRIPTTAEMSSSPLPDIDFGEPEVEAAPEPAPAPAPAPSNDADPGDAAEIARQLANLSPKAAKAVAAAAKATTQEEREAALAEVDESEDPINRDLLLKFLGSVNS
jgi:hypothetical protein